MSDQHINLGKFPQSPYEIGIEAGKTANVTHETMYTTTDGQSTFPYQEIELTVPEATGLIRSPDFVKGFHHGWEQRPKEQTQ